MTFTVDDLEKAREALRAWEDRFDRYTGNNPNKYQSDIKVARREVRMIEDALKANGATPLTKDEQLEKELDAAFPDAKSKQIVEYSGRKFQRRFWPIEKSRSSKTVTEWGRGWTEVSDD
jgi:hypothetical protein